MPRDFKNILNSFSDTGQTILYGHKSTKPRFMGHLFWNLLRGNSLDSQINIL